MMIFRRSKQIQPTAEPRKHSLSKRMYVILRQNTNDFCENTSLHGLKYVTDSKLYPRERIFFALSIVFAFFLSGYFICHVFESWKNDPLIVGINSKPTLITSEPFPAVTICNSNQASKIKMQNYPPHSVEHTLVKMLCKQEVNDSVARSIKNWNNLTHFIMNVSNSCEEMLVSCKYGAVKFNCTQIFRTIVTDEGLCCAFNLVHPKFRLKGPSSYNYKPFSFPPSYEAVDWSTEQGYGPIQSENYIPMPTLGSGESLGLRVLLNVQADQFFCSFFNYVGFKILIHSPNEKSNMRETSLLLSPGTGTKVRIHLDKMETVRSLRSMAKEIRQCLFEDEMELLHFSHYTQRNCVLECEARMSLRICGCISFFLASIVDGAPTCSLHDSKCAEKVHLRAMLANVEDGCQACLPSCFEMTYRPEFYSNALRFQTNGTGVWSSVTKTNHSDTEQFAYVTICFEESSYRSKKQTEYIGITDVLSNIGGLMSLCVGFSFISLIECLFYGIMRCSRSISEEGRRKCERKMTISNLTSTANDYGPGHIWLMRRREFQEKQRQLNRKLEIRCILNKRRGEDHLRASSLRRNAW